MGCGASSEDKGARVSTAEKDTSSTPEKKKGSNGPQSPTQTAANSLTPGSQQFSTSQHPLGTSVSSTSSAINPALTMPTHTIIDSTGHKVSSCISSRTKVDTVTRWLDHIIKHRYDEAGWRDPQEDRFKEKVPVSTQSQGSVQSEQRMIASSPTLDSSMASASQLSLTVPTTPGKGSSLSMVERGSNLPQRPFSPRETLLTPSASRTTPGFEMSGSPTKDQLETPRSEKLATSDAGEHNGKEGEEKEKDKVQEDEKGKNEGVKPATSSTLAPPPLKLGGGNGDPTSSSPINTARSEQSAPPPDATTEPPTSPPPVEEGSKKLPLSPSASEV